jgi:hypothetical protein
VTAITTMSDFSYGAHSPIGIKIGFEHGRCTIAGRQQDVLDALKFEVTFLERGGYERSVREPRKELSIFQDSPACPNYAAQTRTYSCAPCFLIDFVSPEKRGEGAPCHHIPLNEHGETVDSLARSGDDVEVPRAMHGWLRKTIGAIEKAEAEGTAEVEEARPPFFVF